MPKYASDVVREMERFVHRPKIAARAVYYAIIVLNQIELSGSRTALALQLVGIYFTLFARFSVHGKGTCRRDRSVVRVCAQSDIVCA